MQLRSKSRKRENATDDLSATDIMSNGSVALPAAASDTGCERDLNEDRYVSIECASGVAWFVCDGMGGATGGELAAHVAIEAMRRDLEGLPNRSPEVALRSAILEGNRVIVLRRQNPIFSAMGTTVVGCVFSGPELVVANVGDSRAYVIEQGEALQLTVDHTYVQQLVERGEISAEEALSHPQAHVLTRALGAEPSVRVDTRRFWVHREEGSNNSRALLLCSDGLYSLVRDDEIARIVTEEDPQGACVKLVELARERGGYDNITVAVIPLAGPLRDQPPAGYEELRKKQLAAQERRMQPPVDKIALYGTSALLSVVASAVTAVCMLIKLAQ